MWRRTGIVAIAAGAGLLIGLTWAGLRRWETPSPTTASRPPAGDAPQAGEALRTELAALAEDLAAERDARRALGAEVAWLRRELERMALPEAGEEPLEPPAPPAPDGPHADAPESIGVFKAEKLVAAGIPPGEVERLRLRYDRNRMDELYLNDQAAREGGLRTARHRAEIRDLRRSLREEIGEDDYDLLLYAVGKNNRVILADVLRESPAMQTGLLPGDVLVRYDGRRIFNPRELKLATTQGKSGATVAVEVVRGGEQLRFFVPRGPLGVTMRGASHPPSAER